MAAGTSFDTEKLTADAEAIANDRLKGMGIGATGNVAPAEAQATLHAPHGGAAPPAEAPAQTERKTRTTVAKLAQRYQERIEVLESEIKAAENSIALQRVLLDGYQYTLSVWKEALAEITE